MSKESSKWLNTMTLIGNVLKRGTAWHYREEMQGDEPNHYDGPIPVADVLRRLFNFHVVESPLFVPVATVGGENDGAISYVEVPDRKAMVTDDTNEVMGIFKSGYAGHQYDEWLVENVANILDDSIGIESAGLLRNRAQAWVQIGVPESITTPSGVEFRPNLTACTSFDGSLATTYKRTVQAVVCDNTLSAAMSEQGQTYKVKHSKYSAMKISDAREALEIVHTMADDFTAEVERLCNWTVNDKQWAKHLDLMVPMPTQVDADTGATVDATGRGATLAESKRDEIQSLWLYDSRVSPWKNTGFGVLQAYNTYAHHVAGVRKGVHRAQRNMENVLSGKFDALDTEVLSKLSLVTA